MLQAFESEHRVDERGNPAGGHSAACGIEINWQDGPLGRGATRLEPTGAFVETLIAIIIDRLHFYQLSPFMGRQNALAITKLEEALHWLQDRTAEREEREVEGTHEV